VVQKHFSRLKMRPSRPLSANTYQLSASLLSAGFDVHLFLQDSRSDPLSFPTIS
jgi:hypothetical protein